MRFRSCVLVLTLSSLCLATPALADVGADWFAAMQKAKGAAAAKLTVKIGLKHGEKGKDAVVTEKVGKHLGKIFKRIRKQYKGGVIEASDCTSAGRELGYMAGEWRSEDEDLATWIQRIPETFCESNAINPPRVWLLKVLEGERPHAIVIFATGAEDDLINGFYHF